MWTITADDTNLYIKKGGVATTAVVSTGGTSEGKFTKRRLLQQEEPFTALSISSNGTVSLRDVSGAGASQYSLACNTPASRPITTKHPFLLPRYRPFQSS